jgi:hypothetical protein
VQRDADHEEVVTIEPPLTEHPQPGASAAGERDRGRFIGTLRRECLDQPHTPALAAASVRNWFAGALRPGLAKEDMRTVRAAPLSGGWRQIDGNLELVAALAVNLPGFPIVAANQRRGE